MKRALVLLVVLSACGGYQGVRAPHLTPTNRRWDRVLERQARTELGCRTVRLTPLNESVTQVDGCMMVAEYALFCYSRRSCDWRRLEAVAVHAERDLVCPAASLSIGAPSALQRDASGCGRAITYMLGCSDEHCVWSAPAAAIPLGRPAGPAVIEVTAVTSTDAFAIPPPPGSATDGVAIPPPPGSTTSGAATTPPAGTSTTDDIVIPPPPGSTPPPPTTPSTSTDDVVIPPPPR